MVCVNQLNAFFVVSELFDLFDLDDNTPEALRPDDAQRALVFVGYDGKLLLSEPIALPWHGKMISSDDIQPLPRLVRKYPGNYSAIERQLAKAIGGCATSASF